MSDQINAFIKQFDPCSDAAAYLARPIFDALEGCGHEDEAAES